MPRCGPRPAGTLAAGPVGCVDGALLLPEPLPPFLPPLLGVMSPGPWEPPPEDPPPEEPPPLGGGVVLLGPRYWPPCACNSAAVQRTATATGRMREAAAAGPIMTGSSQRPFLARGKRRSDHAPWGQRARADRIARRL